VTFEANSAVAMVTGKIRNKSRADTSSVNVEVSAALSTIADERGPSQITVK